MSQLLSESPRPRWRRKDLLDIASLSVDEVRLILDTADPFREVAGRPVKKVPTLRGKSVFHLTYPESAGLAGGAFAAALDAAAFELAARRLSADSVVVDVAAPGSGAAATVGDALAELDAMAADLVVLRHPEAGLAQSLAGRLSVGLVNAGDGAHEDPVRGLANAYTLDRLRREMAGDREGGGEPGDDGSSLAGCRVALIGDLAASAAARSTLLALTALGAGVVVGGLRTRIPAGLEGMGAEVVDSVDDAVEGAHAILVFPPAPAGEGRDYPSGREYHHLAGLTGERWDRAAAGAPVLHAGPPARGLSISGDVAEATVDFRRRQAADALAVRMAVLYLLPMYRDEAGRDDAGSKGAS